MSESRGEGSENPKVSVLTPVYEGARTLEASVASIQRQTFTDWELILLDDGSGDASYDICRNLAASDLRIRCYRNEINAGLGAAMVRLASLARGEYLAVQEQDDRSPQDRFARQVGVLDREPTIGVVSGVAEWLDAAGRPITCFPGLLRRGEQYPQEHPEMVRFLMLEQCKVVNAACMFRRRLLDDPRVFFDAEARMSVDWQFFVRAAHACRIWGLSEILIFMHRGGDTLSARKQLQFAEARRCLARLLTDFQADPASPIDRQLYRQALRNQKVLEGRFWGGWRGAARFLGVLATNPSHREARESLRQLLGRAIDKMRWNRS